MRKNAQNSRRSGPAAALGWLMLAGTLVGGMPALPASIVATAAAADAPVERTVYTSDGAMYRGEVMEYIAGDHITLKLDTGEQKRIAWNDATQISPPRPKGSKEPPPPPPPPPTPPPTPSKPPPPPTPVPTPVAPGTERTVTNQDGLTMHGEILEWEVGSHIVMRQKNGEKRRIPWGDAKRISPPRTAADTEPGPFSPERTIILRDGTTVRGELVESMLGDYTLLRLPNGQFRRVNWSEAKRILQPRPPGQKSPIPTVGELLVTVDSGSRIQGEFFEYVPDVHLILRHASGRFRIIPLNTIKQIVQLSDASLNQ